VSCLVSAIPFFFYRLTPAPDAKVTSSAS
jgi:hypothetical protein